MSAISIERTIASSVVIPASHEDRSCGQPIS